MQQVIDFGTSEPTLAPILTGDKWDTVWQTLANDEDLNYVDASTGTSMANLITTGTNAIYKALTDGWTMSLAYSSGKDSECVLHLFLMALVRATRNGTNISQHHYVMHTDTGIENPAVRWLADTKLAELEAFVEKHQLPLSIVIGKPGLTSGWTGRILSGRGLPTFSNSSARQCSIDLKVDPARRARAEYMRGLPKAVRQRVCLLLGSRDAESTTRAMNIEKKGGSAEDVKQTKEGGELYPIRHWHQGNVWEFLLSSGDEARFALPSYLPNNNETAELYKEATGECVWTGSEKAKSACGSRFGCYLCQAVGLDRSMENLLNADPEKYGYMAILNRLQRFIAKRRYAWEDRHPVGRTVYEGGYIKIQPDVYSPKFLERLLHICCSADYVEQQRADDVAEKLAYGLLEDNAHNRRMSRPQFRIVSEEAVVHVDFMWAFHHFNDKPFRALEIYHRVWAHGELDLLTDEPTMPVVPQSPIPKAVWLKVGKFGDDSLFDGLADPVAEMTYFDGGDDERAARVIKTRDGHRRVVSFSEDNEVTVDEESASFVLWVEYPRLKSAIESGAYTAGSAAQFYLRFGTVSLCKGKSALYHKMMQRGQTYHRLGLTGFQSMEGITARKDLRILSTEKYQHVLKRTLEARIIRFKWWANLAFTIQYHMTRMTEFGFWLHRVLRQESHNELMDEKTLCKNSLETVLINQTNAWCLVMSDVGNKPDTSNALRRYWRQERARAFAHCASVPEVLKSLVAREMFNIYRRALYELNSHKELSLGLIHIQELATQNADALRIHIKIMMRLIRLWQLSGLTSIGQSEFCEAA
ncbi:TPA_asm: phosphoadenosine phosphosulfate reductase [Salmonella enterica]|uniref:Phosphoadenosine phosphosulfate reductase n=1 Tax=Salmonella enterica TaxID=28901 RepID=A0A723AD77_SALER|nr:phosphoadenosine phosphosulfate reductase family protein [Salmonella enterica subsp. enterica serovar Havana]HAD9411934.1 phosphoadenosine phosphosulfate reductase [Salmonella enterica]HAZ2978792.1 phosphoadenosine phosphosulfate reductase family protein [Salmonella enterica subsp. enterica serovar Havana]